MTSSSGACCVNAGGVRTSPARGLVNDEHAQANGPAHRRTARLWSDYRRWAAGPRPFMARPATRVRACLAGEHTDELLAEAGYSPEEIKSLRADNVVWSEVPMELPEPATVA